MSKPFGGDLGEKGTQIEFWEGKPGSKAETEEDEDKRSGLIHRVYTVFNAQQIDGIPAIAIEPRKTFEVIEEGEHILANSGADIRHGGDRADYSRRSDHVQLPSKKCFTDLNPVKTFLLRSVLYCDRSIPVRFHTLIGMPE